MFLEFCLLFNHVYLQISPPSDDVTEVILLVSFYRDQVCFCHFHNAITIVFNLKMSFEQSSKPYMEQNGMT